jgi:hypothetical protein
VALTSTVADSDGPVQLQPWTFATKAIEAIKTKQIAKTLFLICLPLSLSLSNSQVIKLLFPK